MKKTSEKKTYAWPPREFQCIEDMDDLEKLSEIYSKLMAICSYFSTLRTPDKERPAYASDLYGYWFIIRDICDVLSDILKIDHWTGEIGKKQINEGQAT